MSTGGPVIGDPRLGDRVLYRLDAHDAVKVNSWRDNFARDQAAAPHKHPHPPGGSGASGHIAHVGVPLAAGDTVFADVCEDADPETGRLLLCVNLKGSDTLVVSGVPEGTGPGTWARRT